MHFPSALGIDNLNLEVKMRVLRIARAAWDVLLLADDRDRCGVLEALLDLADQGGRGMLALLKEIVAWTGPPWDNPSLCKKVRGEIWELRKGSVRLFWFADEGKVVVGTVAYKKQGRKAPGRHIDTAEAARREYLAAKRAGTLGLTDLTTKEGATP
ncbi:MAG TPA: type II toxin-antitoxin system RelE/ParE family toxin [Thermoanaerobaculaceae bacterium]|nr:type II toxin-antitoxin system RelE/ParE family toxin [Thermoanaerobaculaceae bacterium]